MTARINANLGTDGRELKGRGRRTRASLIEAAAVVFASHGIHSTRVDDIVARADTSHGTFYRYFPSKDALFAELVGAVAAEVDALVDSLPDLEGDDAGRQAIRGWLDRYAELSERRGPIIRLWTDTDPLGGLTSALARRMMARPPTGLDPTVTSLALAAMCERLNYYVATAQVSATREELLDTLVGVLFSTLSEPAEAEGVG